MSSPITEARAPDHDHLAWLANYARLELRGRAVLDLGTGSGFLCAEAVRRGARHVVGIDVVRPSTVAGWIYQEVDLDRRDWSELVERPRDGQGFDLVTAFDVLEHLE